MTENREVHWTELYGNKFRFMPHPQMLNPGGYQIKLVTKIKGESKNIAVPVIVTFDEEFVTCFFINILDKLQPFNHDIWLQIATKAYKERELR